MLRPSLHHLACALAVVLGCGCLTPSTLRAQAVPPDGMAYVNWVNVPIGDHVIPRYEEWSGKRLLVDNSLAASTITINSIHPMTYEDAVKFIKESLLLNGYAIMEKDDATDVLVGTNTSLVGRDGNRVYVSGDDLPPGDELVTYVMKFDHVTMQEAQTVFQAIAKPNAYTVMSPVENVNAIVITDNVPVIRTLIKLKDEIDVPNTNPVIPQEITLLRADAEEVAGALNEILQEQSQARTGGGAGGQARPNIVISPQGRTPGEAPAGGGDADAGTAVPNADDIIIKAVARTNAILVIARPVDFAYIQALIDIYDAPSQIDNFLKRELKYIPVADFLPVAENALLRYGADTGGAGGGGSALGRTTAGTSTRTTGLSNNRTTGNNTRTNNRTGGNNGFGTTTGGFSGLGGGGTLSSQDIGGPESFTIGNTLIIGDPQLNNIVVSGPPEHLRIIDQLLDEIDIRPRQVYISAVIAQVTLGDDIRKGTDLLRTVDNIDVGGQAVNIAGLYRTAAGSGSSVIDVSALDTIANFPAAAEGLSAWAQIGDFLNAYIEVLENTSRFQVISRPFVYTANNEPASIASGERVAVPTSTTSSLNSTDTINSSIGFEEVLLQLDVVPLINSKDEVTLTISQTNENITGFTTISNNRVPNIATQTFETRVRLPNKAIVVLGGIIQEDDTENVNGLPLLARVPGIKHVLGSSSKSTTRRELLIFLQPHIIESTEDLTERNIEEVNRNIVGPTGLDAARGDPEMDPALFPLGDRPGLFRDRRRGGETFGVEPPEYTEPAAPAADRPRRGLFNRLLHGGEKSDSPPPPTEAPQPKRAGLFRRR